MGSDNELGRTIVLAEDDDGHARLIERNLARSGSVAEIIRLRDGQEAIDFVLRSGKYAARELDGELVMLLDIKLPRVDGISVLQQLKSDPTSRWLPIVMLTTTDSPAEIRRCYELGCNAYLTKPVDYNEFVEVISRLNKFLEVTEVMCEEDA